MLNWKTSNHATKANSPIGIIGIYDDVLSPRGYTKYCVSMEGKEFKERFESETLAIEYAEKTLVEILETRIKLYQDFLDKLEKEK